MVLRNIAVFFLLFHFAFSTCSNYVSVQESTCADIFERLEKAIVDNEVNLYNLRKVFYPTSQMEPTLVNVSYTLKWSPENNMSCPGDIETLPLNPRINPNFTQSSAVWTSSIFYTIFHPALINRLQPQMTQTLLVLLEETYTHDRTPTALTWNTTGPILTVELYLRFQLPCWPTYIAMLESLNDITSVLKVYANSQEKISEWGEDERAYSLSGLVLAQDWWKWTESVYATSLILPLTNAIISIILTVMITFGIYFAIWHVAPSQKDERNFLFSHTVVWCGVALLLQLNTVVFLNEIATVGSWCHYRNSCRDPVGSIKILWLVWMAVYMIIAFVILLIRYLQGKSKQRDLLVPEWRAFIVTIPIISNAILFTVFIYQFSIRYLLKMKSIHNALIHSKETLTYFIKFPRLFKILVKIIKFFSIYILYMTIFISVSIFSFSIVPVLLQAFLYPFRIVATYSFAFTAYVLFFFATFVAAFLWKERKPTTGKLILYLSSPSIGLLFILMITTPFASLYQLLVSGSFSDNPLILAGASLLPTVILSSPLIWAFKQKLLPRFLDIDEEEEEEEEEKEEGKKEKKIPTHKLEEEISSGSIIADVEMQSIPAEIDVTTT